MNSLLYEVEFTDGSVREYSVNLIAENMLTQVDEEGYFLTVVKAIINHKRNLAVAVDKADGFVVTNQGGKRLPKTTEGWKLLIK